MTPLHIPGNGRDYGFTAEDSLACHLVATEVP